MAMDLSAIMAEAKEIGLEGKALQDFVRDERAHQREIERIRLGQIEQEKNRQHELALCEAKRNLPVVTRDNNLPKLPPLDENDEIDAYLCRFENYAEACNWSEDSWSIRLSALLKGQALEVYHGIPKESAHNYAALRKMLLNRFQMTEEGYRQKFRRLRPRVHESFGQFVSRLNLALDRWIEMSEVDSTVQGIKDLALKEQCLEVVSKDLKVFIQERQPKSLGEVIELAENYISVHMLQSANSKWWNQQQRDQNNGSRMHVRERDITKDNKPRDMRDMRELVTVKNERDKGAPRKGCFLCGGKHYARDCRVIQDKAKSESYTNKAQVATVTADWEPVVEGTICGIEEPVSVLRDTGCSTAVIKRKFVKDDQYTGKWVKCKMVNGQIIEVPTATVQVDTPFYEGIITAMVMISPANDLVIGNIPGAKDATNPNLHWKSSEPVTERVAMVTTRSQAIVREKMGEKPMKVHDTEISKVTKDEFRMLQENDETLKGVKEKAERGDGQNKLGNAEFRYVNGLLCRYFSKDGEMGNASGVTQLVVPEKLRKLIMELAHDSILGGHLGVQKTLDRILGEFYWPGVHGDIKRYCRSCDICQRTIPKGRVRKAPLESVPMVNTPFAKVAVDLVGPLLKSSRGYRYILTVVDYATRYPEAIPLKSIETVDVAEALLDIFLRVGIPHEIVSDRGSQFVSDMMKEFMRLLSLKHIKTTPYHAMANGLVEKWNGTLKCMLKRTSCERPKDWDRYIPALLFAYREVPQESLKFSPFELLYGRTVRGPLTIVKEMWLEERENISCPESSHQYILELKSKLEDTCRLAREELRKAKITQKSYYDKRNRCKRPPIKKGDKVLLLLPTDNNKLLLQWKGPFPVVEQVGENDFQIMVNNKVRTYHANMLKKYFVRDENSERACVAEVVTECGVKGVESYVDDIVVHSKDWETHLKILDEVFERLRSGGLTVRPTKCELGKRELSFLGRVIDGSNMFLDDDKVQKVINFKRPQTKSQLRSFIGVVSYHRIHIKEFATILKPLTDLTKKTEPVKVRWNCEAIAAFEKVKELISTKPILKLPDFEREFILATDASETGIGAVLMQDYDGKKLPVKYISRKLTAAESRYSTIERECLALFWATRKFHEYLYSKPFILETDHKPLIFLSSARYANNRVMRWALALQTYQYTIRAVKGSENKIADFLSRC
ncbi:Uncharacterised protein r2_g1413 [Pycnogonum litorale]